MSELDLDTIRHALSAARTGGFSEVRLESGASTFSATLGSLPATHAAGASGSEEGSADEPSKPPAIAITASCVGFYKAVDSVLEVGRKVEKGEIVASISALGLANDVESPVSGEIVEVLINPEDPVEYGQALALVKEAQK